MAQRNSIDTFKSAFYGGTRPNRFDIEATLPDGTALDVFHAYAFNLPEIAIGEIPVNYRGRTVYIPGDRDYMPWNLTILDDRGEGGQIYNALQAWQRSINDHQTNDATAGFETGNRGNWIIQHLDTQGNGGNPAVIKQFTLVGCWLTGIGPVQLNAAEKNALLTFNATVRYDYVSYDIDKITSASADAVAQQTF